MIGDLMADGMADWQVGAEMLDYVPVPARSLSGNMPYNPDDGWGKEANWMLRTVLALPILGLSVVFITMASKIDHQLFNNTIDKRVVTSGLNAFKIADSFHGLGWLDDFWRTPVSVLTPSSFGWDAPAWWQMFSFLIDVSTIYTIWLVEGSRRANFIKWANL
jgi:hypothetical protein